MLRSLFSGVSGMKNNQIKMDVIGNNIANVNTTAFKAGRVLFQDIFSQTLKEAATSRSGIGGTNPRQVGLGMQVSSIDTLMDQGALQPTGRPLDCGIQGEGFFIISVDGSEDANKIYSSSKNIFTRDGAFKLDAYGNLLTADGYRVMGAPPLSDYSGIDPINTTDMNNLRGITIPKTLRIGSEDINISDFSIDVDGTIRGVYGNEIKVLGQLILATFDNPAGLKKLGGNNYQETSNSGLADVAPGASKGYGEIRQNTLEMSNVDLASEFTEMVITSRAFQANSRTITTSDEMLQELLNLKR